MSAQAEEAGKRRHRSRSHSKATITKRPPALWLIAALCLLATFWLLPEASRQLRADLATGPARSATTRLGTPRPLTTEEDWQDALEALERSVAISPDDASTQADLGALYGSASLRADITPEQRAEYALSARLHDQLVTQLRPTEPRGWAELARAELLTGNAGPDYVRAWELAAQLGAGEAMVQSQLLELVMATYPDPHTVAMAEWVRQIQLSASPQKQLALAKVAQSFDLTIASDGGLAPLPAEPAAASASASSGVAQRP